MVERNELWRQIQAAQGAIVQNLAPKVQSVLQDSKFNGVQGWFHLGLAYYIRPEAITVKRVQIRNPYSHADNLAQDIQNLLDAGFLDKDGVIVQEAYDIYQGLIDAQDAAARKLDLMPESDLTKITAYLERALDAASELNAPVLKDVSTTDLPDNPVHRIYYIAYRLAALRDDAHIQAWSHLNVDGHIYEASSLVWADAATNAAKFMELRGNRGYEETDWQATLDKLVEKGWLVKTGDDYAASDEYKELREDIETKTDDFFYKAFESLSDEEVEHLFTLLKDVQAKFTPEPETP